MAETAENKDPNEKVQRNLILTNRHVYYLQELAKSRALDKSTFVRTLLEEEWRRKGMDKRREGSPGG